MLTKEEESRFYCISRKHTDSTQRSRMPSTIELPYNVTFFMYGVQFVTDSSLNYIKKLFYNRYKSCWHIQGRYLIENARISVSFVFSCFLSFYFFCQFSAFYILFNFLINFPLNIINQNK